MTSVDKRVVQMEFDDAQFDEGAKRAIDTLEKLDKSLALKNATKGLKNLQSATRSFSLSGISSQIVGAQSKVVEFASHATSLISSVASKMMSFGKVATGVITGIGASIGAIAVSKGISRALNIEQAKFQMKGLGMDIEATMEDVSYAVDGTRYGLDSAAKAAGQLGASGIKAGDQMKQALRGISGVASMTNAEFEEISPIFTTIAGQGQVMTMQLRQLESRGLNAAATLAKELKTSEANVREMVTKGKIDFDTFAKAMNNAFGEQAKKANDTFTGAMANTKAAIGRIGAEIAIPGIENIRQVLIDVMPIINTAKATFTSFGKTITREVTDLPKSTKATIDKVGKYTNAFGQDIVKKGKKYYKVYKEFRLYGTIAKDMQKLRNSIKSFLQTALNSKMFERFIRGLVKGYLGFRNILQSIFTLLSPFGEAVSEIFKPFATWKYIKNSTNSFLEFTKALKNAVEKGALLNKVIKPIATALGGWLGKAAQSASNFLLKLFSNLATGTKHFRKFEKNVTKTFKPIIKGFKNLIKTAKNIGEAVKIFFKPLSDAFSNLKQMSGDWFSSFTSQFNLFDNPALAQIGSIFKPITDFITAIKEKGIGKVFLDWSKNVLSWSESLKQAASESKAVQTFLETASKIFEKLSNVAGVAFGAISGVVSKISSLLGAAASKLKSIFDAVSPSVKDLAYKGFELLKQKASEIVSFFQSIDWSPLSSAIDNIAQSLGSFVDSLMNGESPLTAFKEFISDIIEILGGVGGNIGSSLSDIPKMFSDLVSSADSGELVSFGDGIKYIADVAGTLFDKVSGLGTAIKENLTDPWEKITAPINEANAAMGDVNESITSVFTSIDDGEANAEDKVTSLTDAVNKFKDGLSFDDAQSLLTLGTTGAIGIFSVSFMRSSAKAAKAFAATSTSLKDSITQIADIPKTLKGFQKSLQQEVKYNSVLKVAAALLAIAGALKIMSTIDPANMLISAAILLVFMRALEKFYTYFELINPKSIETTSNMLLKFAAAMMVFAVAMRLLGSMSWEDIGKGVAAIAGFLGALYLMLGKTNLGKLASNVGTQVLKLSVGLIAIAVAIGILGSMDVDTARNGIIRLAAVFGTLFVFFALLKKAKITSMVIQLQGFAIALLGMVAAMAIMALMPFEKMIQGWFGLTMVLASLAAFSAAMKKFAGGKMAEIGASLLILSGSLILMSGALAILSMIPIPGLIVSIIAMAAALGILVAAAYLVGGVAIPFSIFAKSVLLLSASIAVAGLGLIAFSVGLITLGAALVLSGEQIANNIGSLFALAGVGLLLLPAAVVFAIMSASALLLGAAVLTASLGLLAFAGAIAALNSVGAQGIVDTMHGIAEGFTELIVTLGNNSQQIADGFMKIIDSILSVLREAVPKVALLAVDIIVAIVQGLALNAGRLAAAGLMLIANLLNGIAAGLGAIIQAAINLALTFVTGLAAGIRANRDQFGSAALDLIGALLEAILSTIGQLLAAGAGIVGTVVEGIMSAIGLGDMGKAAHEAIDSFINGAGDAIGSLLGWGKEASETAAQGMEEGADKASDSGAKIAENTASGIQDGSDNVFDAASGMVDDTVGAITEGFSGDGVFDAASGMVDDTVGAITEGFSGDGASEAASDFMANISSSVGDGKDDVLSQFESFGPDISDALGSGINPDSMKSGLVGVVDTGFTAADTEATKKAATSGKDAASKYGKAASANTDKAKSGGKELGTAIGDGAVSGIDAKISAVCTKAAEMVRKAVAAAKKEGGVNSPSKVFIEIGKNLDEGLIIGIDSMSDEAAASGRKLAKKTVKAAESTLSLLGGISDDLDLSPTIRPVVDLSEIQKGVATANSIFSDQSALQASMSLNSNRFYDPTGQSKAMTTKQVNNTISISLDYNAGADANQIVRDIATGLMNQAFMEA